jgi:hypothetical protein
LIKDTPFGRRGKNELGIVEFRASSSTFSTSSILFAGKHRARYGFGLISRTAGSSRQIQFSLKLIY